MGKTKTFVSIYLSKLSKLICEGKHQIWWRLWWNQTECNMRRHAEYHNMRKIRLLLKLWNSPWSHGKQQLRDFTEEWKLQFLGLKWQYKNKKTRHAQKLERTLTAENGHCRLRLSVWSLLRPMRVCCNRVCVADKHLGIKLFTVWSPNDAHVPDNNHKQPNNNSTVALWASPHGPQSLTRLRSSTLITVGRKVGGHCKTLLWIIHSLEFPTRTLNRLREQERLCVLQFSDAYPPR